MGLVVFSKLFPEIGPAETRVIIVPSGCPMPEDRYAFTELYCEDPDCHCRQVMFCVMSETTNEVLAFIRYRFNRYGSFESEPFLDPSWKQSELAPHLLILAKEVLLVDKDYLKRLERHYAMVKALEPGSRPTAAAELPEETPSKRARASVAKRGKRGRGKNHRNRHKRKRR